MYKDRMNGYKTLYDSAMELINDRLSRKTMNKDDPKHPDILERMLNKIDKETKEKMDITLVRNHLILFLLVGHDSTSSLLISLIYVLTQHPDVEEEKIREEVEIVIGGAAPNMENIKKISYMMVGYQRNPSNISSYSRVGQNLP